MQNKKYPSYLYNGYASNIPIDNGLSLIGVKTTLSGISARNCYKAIQLGLLFADISIDSTLSKAIEQDKNSKKID